MRMSVVLEKNISPEQVTELALNLTPYQQSLLVARLHDNLQSLDQDPEHEAAWASEIERRLRDMENGDVELIDHDVAMKRLRDRFRQR